MAIKISAKKDKAVSQSKALDFTRFQFMRNASSPKVSVGNVTFELDTYEFSSGGLGFFGNERKVRLYVPGLGREVTVNLSVTVTVADTKDLPAMTAAEVAEIEGLDTKPAGTPDEPAELS